MGQLKHILPEAIEIKRVLIYDETTSCMKPDLHVTLNADAVEYDDKSKSESKKIALRKVFRARLADFVKAHPQVLFPVWCILYMCSGSYIVDFILIEFLIICFRAMKFQRNRFPSYITEGKQTKTLLSRLRVLVLSWKRWLLYQQLH